MKFPNKKALMNLKSRSFAFVKRQWLGSALFVVLIVGMIGNGGDPFTVGNNSSSKGGDFGYAEEMMMDSYDSAGITSEFSQSSRSVASTDPVVAETIESKIIKTGSLSLHVDEVRDTTDAIESEVLAWGGSVLSSNVMRGSYSYTSYMDVRVPSDKFEMAMDTLKGMALYVSSENSNAQDVTDAYIDLAARLNNLEEEEEQYLSILDSAGTMTEILEVTKAISTVRYEIESIESSLSYYDTRVAFSTISISLSEDESVSVVTDQWRPGSTLNDAFSEWVDWLQERVDQVIYLGIFGWPFALLALIVWAVWRRRKKS
jgi:hypothetical protein